MDGHITVLTWKAECHLMLGDFEQGRILAEEAIREAGAYAKYLVSGWPLIVNAEYFMLRGKFPDALHALEKGRRVLMSNGNIQGSYWCHLLEGRCLKDVSLNLAAKMFGQLQERLKQRMLAQVQARLYLEEAELARERHDWRLVASALRKLRAFLRDKTNFSSLPHMLLAHARLVEAECERDRSSSDAPILLRQARSAYERLGAKAQIARTNVAIALTGCWDVPRAELLAECRRFSYDCEVARLASMDAGFYPINFI